MLLPPGAEQAVGLKVGYDAPVGLLNKHGGGFLHVIAAGVQQGVVSKTWTGGEIASCVTPGHSADFGFGQGFDGFERIAPYADRGFAAGECGA